MYLNSAKQAYLEKRFYGLRYIRHAFSMTLFATVILCTTFDTDSMRKMGWIEKDGDLDEPRTGIFLYYFSVILLRVGTVSNSTFSLQIGRSFKE